MRRQRARPSPPEPFQLGALLEEWRAGRTAAGRASASFWRLLTSGSRYEHRLPIGEEGVIRTVSAEVVRGFYRKRYLLPQMAAVVVGDFEAAGTSAEQVVY